MRFFFNIRSLNSTISILFIILLNNICYGTPINDDFEYLHLLRSNGDKISYSIPKDSPLIIKFSEKSIIIQDDTYNIMDITGYYLSKNGSTGIDNTLYNPESSIFIQNDILHINTHGVLTIYTINGQILTQRIIKETNLYDLTSLPSGFYIVSFNNSAIKYIRK